MPIQLSRNEFCSASAPGGVVAALLLEASETIAIDRAAAKALVARVVEMLDATDDGAPGGALAAWQAKRVDSYIEGHLAETITVEQLAVHAKLSASYFGRAFKASFGDTPHAYILRKRIALARKLMLESRAPLAEIALECGMADQSHLNRVFRRFTGTSPHAWRRSMAAAA